MLQVVLNSSFFRSLSLLAGFPCWGSHQNTNCVLRKTPRAQNSGLPQVCGTLKFGIPTNCKVADCRNLEFRPIARMGIAGIRNFSQLQGCGKPEFGIPGFYTGTEGRNSLFRFDMGEKQQIHSVFVTVDLLSKLLIANQRY